MGRRACYSKEELNRGAWTAEEDKILSEYIQLHGEGRWRNLPKEAGLKRCGKSCRLRWLNYLRPGIKRGNISPDEEELIIRLHKLLGNRWSLIAGRLPGRTDNEIKNYWNTNLGKKAHHPPPSKTNKSNQSDHIETTPQVVRTKAIKCTKVVLNYDPPSHHHDHQDHKVEQFDADKQISPMSLDSISLVEANTLNNIGSSSSSFTTTATATTTKDISSADFVLNFNLEELCLPDLLNSDFSDICDFNYSSIDIDKSHQSKDLSLPNSKDVQAIIMSSEEMLQSCWSSTGSVKDCVLYQM